MQRVPHYTDFGTWDFVLSKICISWTLVFYFTVQNKCSITGPVEMWRGTGSTNPPKFWPIWKSEQRNNRLLDFASKLIGSGLPVKSSNFLSFRCNSPIIDNHRLLVHLTFNKYNKTNMQARLGFWIPKSREL